MMNTPRKQRNTSPFVYFYEGIPNEGDVAN